KTREPVTTPPAQRLADPERIPTPPAEPERIPTPPVEPERIPTPPSEPKEGLLHLLRDHLWRGWISLFL
ncbi:hypothetical protein TNIN_168231, partial [Trichonephila inaurata madagascariensis]